MKKIAFLTCDDLTDYVVDDNLLYDKIKTKHPELEFDVVSWSNPDVNWSDYKLAILRTTWDYTKKVDTFLEKMSHIQKCGCDLYNSLNVLKWNSYKTYLKKLSDKEIPIIESHFLEFESESEIVSVLSESKKYVIKPVVGASADNIQILSKTEITNLIQKIYRQGLVESKKWFIQPFIEEVIMGEKSLFFLSSNFSHAVKKVPKSGDFRVQEEHGGIITSYKPTDDEFQFAKNVLKAIDEELFYARIDFLNTANGPQVIELELIEPSFYFRTDLKSVDLFIDNILSIL